MGQMGRMVPQKRCTEFTTVSVTPGLRNDLRETRDEHGYGSYDKLLRAMKAQFDPTDGKA